jgi:hypothetical protein
VKRTGLDGTRYLFDDNNVTSTDMFISSDKIFIQLNGLSNRCITNAVFRDPSAWYHIVWRVDTTQATAANRNRLYVNGVEQTFSSSAYPAQNTDAGINTTTLHRIGGVFDGYLADIHFIDGQALDPTSFGEYDTNGIWQPIEYTGSYGTNGFHLDFADNASTTTIGYDAAGSNDWTANNLSVTAGAGNDSLVDVPTNGAETDTGAGGEVKGNYCTWNPLTGAITLTNGNLDGNSTGGAWRGATGTAGVLSGKWYWESTIQNTDSGNYYGEFGFIKTTDITGAITNPSGMNGIVYYARNGNKYSGGSATSTSSSGATTDDIVQVAIDLDAGKIWFGVNNTWVDSGNPASGTNAAYTGLSGTYLPVIGVFDGGKCNTNFGQRPFAYTAPSGFKALNTANLPAPLVTKPSTVMDVALYTGNAASRSITGLGFSPDFVWIKNRSNATGYFHALFDIVRGANKILASNSTAAEDVKTQQLTAFTSDGFSLGDNSDGGNYVNLSGDSYVAWAWDAGSSTVTNTSGSISSQVRANASAGFSVVTYTGDGSAGATVGHGLGVAPQMIIVKNRDAADAWQVYHSANTANPETDYLVLNTTAATADALDRWNDTAPTSTVFSLGDGVEVNTNTEDYVAYCWTGLVGYSSFGSYTGNGSADGPFVYLGFRPALVMVKMSSSTGNWTILDDKREGYNVDNDPLFPNLSTAEGTTDLIDITSNGFKVRTTDATFNTNAGTYIYAAWASSPFAYSRAR